MLLSLEKHKFFLAIFNFQTFKSFIDLIMNMQLLISFVSFFTYVTAHSWVECVDYNGPLDVYNPSQCNGFPRPLSSGRGPGHGTGIFGGDIGMDHRPGNSGNQCQGNVAAGLTSNYPSGVVNYEAGKTYTLAWPPKNHVAAACTNPYIPDTALDLFVAPYNGASDPPLFTQAVPASFSDERHEMNKIDFKGFQNCPLFCENPDKALCTGTFTVPNNLAPGMYTFQWHWAFNSATDIYSTCWEANVVGGTGSTSTAASTTTSTTLPQSTSGSWNNGMKLTHFWDCNGMGCDATTLQPWDDDNYVAAPGYSPQDPNDFGGSVYGEKMWVVGAASDTLAQMLGADDGCCGSDNASMGCGKCALIRVPSATNGDWTALIMKKNRCPPNSNGCEAGNVHFDVAVPGYDNLQFSTANICGQRAGTGFTSAQESAVLGDWYTQFPNTAQAASRCSSLPAEFQKGCQLFSEWGWTRGDPNAEYQVVDCPSAFKDYVADQFNENGVVTSSTTGLPDTTTTTTTSLQTTSTTSSSSNDGDGACFIMQCGCPDSFKESWCTIESHKMADDFCGSNQQNCEVCNGIFCPYDGPGGPVTSTSTGSPSTTTTSPQAPGPCGETKTAVHDGRTETGNGGLPLTIYQCSAANGCVEEQMYVTLDANWRWYYHTRNYQNCFNSGEGYDCQGDCSDCVLTDQMDYFDTYGISTDGTELKLTYVLPSEYGGYGARTYLVDGTGTNAEYKMFTLDLENGWEFSFDVDLSRIPCAMNDALYFVEMEKDGGKSRGSQGPHYGTGYCDAQCPDDLHHVDGEANPPNADGWAKRQCCAEMDVWEANSISNALTPHTCELPNGDDMVGVFECTDDEMCGVSDRYTSVCDRDGCDFNAFRLGDETFYGPGEEFTVNTLKPMTVTTRWIVENGELKEIGRIYYQEGKEIPQTMVDIEGSVFNTITDATCLKMRDYWANKQNTYLQKGGMKSMGESMARGHVLVMSLWHDDYVQMKWLDAELGEDPGRTRGSCSGDQIDFDSQEAHDAYVTFANVRYGEIGSTVPDCATSTTTADSTSTTTSASTSTTTPSSDVYVDLQFDQQPADFTFGQSVQVESQALRFETSTANFGKGFLKSTFSVPGSNWGRIWMKLDAVSLTANLGHWVAVAGGVGSKQIRMMDINSNEAGKVVFQLGWDDDAFQKVTSWSNKYSLSTDWTCYEWHMDSTAQTFDFYVSGNPVTWDSPQNIGSNVPSGRQLPENLDWIGFGVESFGGAATTIGGNFDNIVVSATRVGCGSPPVDSTSTTSTSTTSTTLPSTTTTTVPTTTATTTATCGFVPTKCGRAIENNFNKINEKSFGKFEKITGVTQEEATLDDMTLYFYCKGKAASRCGDLQLPCTCSRPPCVCPGATTTTTATTSTTAPITTSTTTKATTTSATTAASTTTTKSSQNR